jgi:hypothetical protein
MEQDLPRSGPGSWLRSFATSPSCIYILPGPLGSSIPSISARRIWLYASCDNGVTLDYMSDITDGGEAIPENNYTLFWEPSLLYHEGQLVVYYGDQRKLTRPCTRQSPKASTGT